MGPHVEFSGETFFPLCETFLPAGSGLNSKIHMAVMKEAQPAFDLAQRCPPCGPAVADLDTHPRTLSSGHCLFLFRALSCLLGIHFLLTLLCST